ncbi:hypothetical protein BDQ17DRAFT_1423308 [Cyathus striatus]|nr:hypothetical protein BDQ17DRAFT_1423308 [Cyathus striatus]
MYPDMDITVMETMSCPLVHCMQIFMLLESNSKMVQVSQQWEQSCGGCSTSRGSSAGAKAAIINDKLEDRCDAPAVKADAAICFSAELSHGPTDISWNADTGAMAHMTPHCSWLTSNTKCGAYQ